MIEADPSQSICILTHYCPSRDERALNGLDDEHVNLVSTDMEWFMFWHVPQLKLWAFGGTGHNCTLHNERIRRFLYTNQRGTGSPDEPHSCSHFRPTDRTHVYPMIYDVQNGRMS